MTVADGLLAKLSEVQEQQRASSASIELLRDQHREWKRSVDELLAGIHALSTQVPAPPLPAAPAVHVAPARKALEDDEIHPPYGDDNNRDSADDDNNENANCQDEPSRAIISRRSMSTESLLRSPKERPATGSFTPS